MKNIMRLLTFSMVLFSATKAFATSSYNYDSEIDPASLTPFQKKILTRDFQGDMGKYQEHLKKLDSAERRVDQRLGLDKEDKKSHKK